MSDYAIRIEALKKKFGKHEVLLDVNLSVPTGSTFAFLGRNGQGKTTTIRMMLGLLQPDGGRILVDSQNPARAPLAVRQRVGYLAEDQRMFGWMTVAETIRFVKPFYDMWDDVHAAKLLKDFDLSPKQRVSTLSKGQNIRLGLLLALAHRPQTVILDDPTLGLDPIMRREFMRDVIEHLQGNGCTVFFSSHLLYEIEPVADIVAVLDGGTIIRQASTEELRASVRQFVISAEDNDRLGALPSLLDAKPAGRQVAFIADKADEARERLTSGGITFKENELNLDDIFEAYVIGNRGGKERRS